MRQQRYEKALRDIRAAMQNGGRTFSHDHAGDRRRANAIIGAIAKIVNEALEEADHDRQDPDHR